MLLQQTSSNQFFSNAAQLNVHYCQKHNQTSQDENKTIKAEFRFPIAVPISEKSCPVSKKKSWNS
jgi:hypothetical protein